MKIVPTSLEESQNFERGLDPKTVMRIGRIELVYADFMEGDYDNYEIISSDEGKYFISLKTAEKIFQKCEKYKEGTNDFDEEIEVRIFEGLPLISILSSDYGILSIWTRNEDAEKIILLMRNKRGKSLEESQNFERGLDPKISMDIGMNRPLQIGDVVYLLSMATMEPFDSGRIVRFQSEDEIEVATPRGNIVMLKQYLERARPGVNLKESLNFERGTDPKKSMDIGIAQKMKKMLSRIHMEPRMAAHDYFSFLGGVPKNENIIVAIKSILWKIIYDKKPPITAFRITCLDWQISESDANLIREVLKRELNLTINESLDFQRGIDPKASMSIGDAAILPPLIDSNILFAISTIEMRYDEDEGDRTEDEMREDEENYQLVKRAEKFLKGKATFGKYFDWKEEDDMIEYIQKYARGRYVYNATPGQDGWQVVFSKVYLPRAEEIDI